MGRELQPRLRLLPRSRTVRVVFVRILIESGEVRPPVDDLANMPGRERLVEFERAVIDDRLEDEGVVAVAVKVLPAPGVQLYIFRKVAECFHNLPHSIHKQAVIRLPATLMICAIVTVPASSFAWFFSLRSRMRGMIMSTCR